MSCCFLWGSLWDPFFMGGGVTTPASVYFFGLPVFQMPGGRGRGSSANWEHLGPVLPVFKALADAVSLSLPLCCCGPRSGALLVWFGLVWLCYFSFMVLHSTTPTRTLFTHALHAHGSFTHTRITDITDFHIPQVYI